MTTPLTARMAAELDCEAVAAAGDLERRRAALRLLQAQGLPSSRDDNWKYVNLRALERLRFAPPATAPSPPVSLEELPASTAGYGRYVFVDGRFAPELSDTLNCIEVNASSTPELVAHRARAPDLSGLHSTEPPVRRAPDDVRRAPDDVRGAPDDLRLALLNDAFATDGARIRVSAGAACPSCMELVFLATADGKSAASYPRIELQVERGARVSLIERHVSARSDANFVNSAVAVHVAAHGTLEHYRVQQNGARAISFDTLRATLANDARYQLHTVSLGGQSARSTLHLQLAGERSEVGLYSVAVGNRAQVHDTFALIEHVARDARTEQSFRGIASGRSRVAFNSKIVVRQGAQRTESRQSLRGLLAGPEAEIDVRPQLEIYTDDVRCNHGATAGKLDENMLFYLLSRGLERADALRILKWAFLEDVVARITVPELRRQIEQSLANQLDEAAALKELL